MILLTHWHCIESSAYQTFFLEALGPIDALLISEALLIQR